MIRASGERPGWPSITVRVGTARPDRAPLPDTVQVSTVSRDQEMSGSRSAARPGRWGRSGTPAGSETRRVGRREAAGRAELGSRRRRAVAGRDGGHGRPVRQFAVLVPQAVQQVAADGDADRAGRVSYAVDDQGAVVGQPGEQTAVRGECQADEVVARAGDGGKADGAGRAGDAQGQRGDGRVGQDGASRGRRGSRRGSAASSGGDSSGPWPGTAGPPGAGSPRLLPRGGRHLPQAHPRAAEYLAVDDGAAVGSQRRLPVPGVTRGLGAVAQRA